MLRSRKLFGSDPSLAPLECRLRDELLLDALLSIDVPTERTESGLQLLFITLLDLGVSASIIDWCSMPRIVGDPID